ncbi:MAG TPA: hypothetical protein PK992_20175, partial [Planctomycetaceae bacterium]|nr:hypothetical protein [Planctomycetaceae bacterium]
RLAFRIFRAGMHVALFANIIAGQAVLLLLQKETFEGILVSDDELLTFVIPPEADGTNNISERLLRDAA